MAGKGTSPLKNKRSVARKPISYPCLAQIVIRQFVHQLRNTVSAFTPIAINFCNGVVPCRSDAFDRPAEVRDTNGA